MADSCILGRVAPLCSVKPASIGFRLKIIEDKLISFRNFINPITATTKTV